MDLDIISYVIGLKNGEKTVTLDSESGYTFTDANSDGNVVIEEVSEE